MQQIAFIGGFPTKINLNIPNIPHIKVTYNKVVDYYKIRSFGGSALALLPKEYNWTMAIGDNIWLFAKNYNILKLLASYSIDTSLVDYEDVKINEINEEPIHQSYKWYLLYDNMDHKFYQFTTDYDINIINDIFGSIYSLQSFISNRVCNETFNLSRLNSVLLLHMEDIIDFKMYMNNNNITVSTNTINDDNLILIYEFTRQNKTTNIF